jgi:ethanolaminephosphotransferase
MFNVIANIVINYYSGLDGKKDIPTWAIVMTAILYPLYHIFDLIDGKHARKTGQSSPLGLLVDHGCDALTTFLYTMCLGSILKLEGVFWYSLIWLMTSINFFACTWEEYQTGRLDFPCIHGVSEGTFLSAAIVIFTAIVGQDFWLIPVEMFGSEHRLSNLFVSVFFIFSLLFVFSNFRKVLTSDKVNSFSGALSNLFVFYQLVLSLLIVCYFSKCSYIENYPKLIVFMYGLAFCKLVVK